MCGDSSLESLIRAYYEPVKTDKYGGRFTLWPFWLAALAVLGVAVAVLVVTNQNAQTCSDQLTFANWDGDQQAAGCQLYDSAYGDWTTFLNLALIDQPLPTYINPTATSSGAYGSIGLYTPTNCTNTFPTNYESVNITFYAIDPNTTAVGLVATVGWSPPFLLGIVAQLPASLQPLIPVGSLALVDHNVALSLRPIVLPTTTYTDPTVINLILAAYWDILPSQVGLMVTEACVRFVETKHLQQCHVCTRDSAVSIAYIVILAFLQVLSLVNVGTMYLVQQWNRQYLSGPERDDNTWVIRLVRCCCRRGVPSGTPAGNPTPQIDVARVEAHEHSEKAANAHSHYHYNTISSPTSASISPTLVHSTGSSPSTQYSSPPVPVRMPRTVMPEGVVPPAHGHGVVSDPYAEERKSDV